MPSKFSFKTRFFSTVLIGVFCFVQIAPALAISSSPKHSQQSAHDKGFLDPFRHIIRGERICLGPVCINSGNITEALLRDQIKEFAENNAPVTVSTNHAYPSVRTLPGEAFQPRMLDLQAASPSSVISAGDYIVPVQVFCLQPSAGSPDGHRYVLGQYGGSQREVLADLNRAAASTSIPHADIQGVSWAIQSGVSYDEMPSDMQQIVDQLIPQHRSKLNGDFWDKIDSIWNTASRYIDLPSFESFLSSKLGETGETLVALKDFKDRLASRSEDWRNLSSSFITDSASQAGSEGNILETPWSKLSDRVYARFLTSGNYDDIGLLELRIVGSRTSSSSHEQFVSNKQNVEQGNDKNDVAPPPPGENSSDDDPEAQPQHDSFSYGNINDLISTIATIPVGSTSVQPFSMTAASDESWLSSLTDWIDTLADQFPDWNKIKGAIGQATDLSSAAQVVQNWGLCNWLPNTNGGGVGSTTGTVAGSTAVMTAPGTLTIPPIKFPPIEISPEVAAATSGAAATVGTSIVGLCLYGYYISQPVLTQNTSDSGGGNNSDQSSEDISRQIDEALKSGNKGIQEEGRAADAIREAGIEIEKFQYKLGTNGSLGEIDIETSQAIIEVTTSNDGRLKDVIDLMQNPIKNPSGKPVILYAPKYIPSATKSVTNAGGLVVKNPQDLVGLLRSLQSSN